MAMMRMFWKRSSRFPLTSKHYVYVSNSVEEVLARVALVVVFVRVGIVLLSMGSNLDGKSV
jgi:hypothetical protein